MAYIAKASILPMILSLLMAVAPSLPAANEGAKEDLQEGIRLFTSGLYDNAITAFQNVLLDTSATPVLKASGYFWLAKAYMAVGRLEEAEKYLETYLASFPGGVDYGEALYQKGRLLFMQEEYDNTIQQLQQFLSKYPQSSLVANAYFWVAESLYNLGRLDEASAVFKKIVVDYPSSFKVETAQYRLSVIDLVRRELELTKLVKWSHEDFLKSVEQFQLRERTYQQAIESLQKKLASTGQLQDEKTIADLRSSLEKKSAEAEALSAQIQDLKDQLADQAASLATAQAQATAPSPAEVAAAQAQAAAAAASLQDIEKRKADLDRVSRMLEVKQDALALKEAYLAWLERNGGKR
jgi:tetratricopeptide (TPR) repeat protein